jgi:hypothetical protein
MTDSEVLEGSKVPGFDHVFVVGSHDSRVTFFSQQVRALNLVDALLNVDGLANRWRFAIVGGGAAGLTTAAALALEVPNAVVHLFDREQEMMHLQSACWKRNLHPHIYDWPKPSATSNHADLPVLDWSAGPAAKVAKGISQTFSQINSILPELRFRAWHTVTSIERAGSDYLVRYVDESSGSPGKSGSATYNAVFLTVGFGPERVTFPQFPPRAYWSDAGVPERSKNAIAGNRVLVTGNGDGGLIDLAAVCLPNMDHSELIRFVATYPHIAILHDPLLKIEREALGMPAATTRFDFVQAYERELSEGLEDLGLLTEIADRLRRRAAVYFHTLDPEVLQPKSSILNRFIVFLVLKTSERCGHPTIRHVSGPLKVLPNAPTGSPEIAGRYWFDAGSEAFGVDEVIVRHGPEVGLAFSGFTEIGQKYKAAHEDWLATNPLRGMPPQLTLGARRRFAAAVARHGLAVNTAPSNLRRPNVSVADDQFLRGVPRCSMPSCPATASEAHKLDVGAPLWLCARHSDEAQSGRLPRELLLAARDYLTGSTKPFLEINDRIEMLRFLYAQIEVANGFGMRLNYVGPLMVHPQWYHERRDATTAAPNPDSALFQKLLQRSHVRYSDVKLLLRNVPRYAAKVNELVGPTERQKFIDETLANIDLMWPGDGERGPDLLCLETGFHRHQFIFSRSLIEMVRMTPGAPSEAATVWTDESYIDMQRARFDRLFAEYKREIGSELQTLKSFIESLWKEH